MNKLCLILVLVTAFLLTGCSADAPQPNITPESPASEDQPAAADSALTRLDEQGEISVKVTPLNLDASGQTIDFAIILDTHSVDLSMDLAGLALLTNSAGLRVDPLAWQAPSGGHHVEGTLSFPAEADGKMLLEASSLTLILRDVDAPERTFTWDLDQ